MPKYRDMLVKIDTMMDKEERGRRALAEYCWKWRGRALSLSRLSGIHPTAICKMCKGPYPISLEAAVALEVATEGELKATALCPSRAQLLEALWLLRNVSEGIDGNQLRRIKH